MVAREGRSGSSRRLRTDKVGWELIRHVLRDGGRQARALRWSCVVQGWQSQEIRGSKKFLAMQMRES